MGGADFVLGVGAGLEWRGKGGREFEEIVSKGKRCEVGRKGAD